MEDKELDILIDWELAIHCADSKEHRLLHTAEYKDIPIIRETHTKYKNDIPGKSETIYWTPKNKKSYKTLEELLRSIDKEAN